VLERLIWLPFSFSFAIFIVGGDRMVMTMMAVVMSKLHGTVSELYSTVRYLYSCVPMRLTSNTVF
jgi:hypothetical protein